MRATTGDFLERCRVKSGLTRSDRSMGFNGAFFIPNRLTPGVTFKVICSDGMGWEHVSVSLPNRCPTWAEMCWLKELFWADDETVMQLHPPKSAHVNNARFCLHLWRPTTQEIPQPHEWMVGLKELGTLD